MLLLQDIKVYTSTHKLSAHKSANSQLGCDID
jgi:hypothetical protein